jgi:hypothetical protein
MAYNLGPNMVISLEAAEDLSAKQYYFVALDANGKAANVAADTSNPIGVLQNKPTLGQSAEVIIQGVSKLECNAAIALAATGTGTEVSCEFDTTAGNIATGRAQASVAGQHVAGKLLTASGAQGDIVTAAITFDGRIKL